MITPPRLPAIESRPGWEARWQLTLIEPVLEPPEELADYARPRPRSNVVVSVAPTNQEDARAATTAFLDQARSQVPGLELDSECLDIIFHDGSAGARQDISFVAGGVKLKQAHLFRVDGDVTTQLVITSDAARSGQDFESIVADVLSFSPIPE